MIQIQHVHEVPTARSKRERLGSQQKARDIEGGKDKRRQREKDERDDQSSSYSREIFFFFFLLLSVSRKDCMIPYTYPFNACFSQCPAGLFLLLYSR